MLHWPRITLTRFPVSLADGIGCSMVPLIQLKMVLLAQIATASIVVAVIVNPGDSAKLPQGKTNILKEPCHRRLQYEFCSLGNESIALSIVHAVRQSTSLRKPLAVINMAQKVSFRVHSFSVRLRALCVRIRTVPVES